MNRRPAPGRAPGAETRLPLVIPVFIPHEGCPHRCLFCNQRLITGRSGAPVSPGEVAATVAAWLERNPHRANGAEIAFYGGSFTALPPARQEELLAAAAPFLASGRLGAVRLSTRPDAIDREGLARLRRYGVATIELGAQSCDEGVLRAAGRGHGAAVVAQAAQLIREEGFNLGIQLMIGLPGDCFRSLRRTAGTVIGLRPDFVRIYPVLVLAGSGLAELYRRGQYRPLSLGRAVALAAYLHRRFGEAAIRVARMGLQPSADLEASLVAGPYHPAFGELVVSRCMLRRTRRILAGLKAGERGVLVIAERDRSVFAGSRSANIERLRRLGLLERFILRTDPGQTRQTLRLEPFIQTTDHRPDHAQHQ